MPRPRAFRELRRLNRRPVSVRRRSNSVLTAWSARHKPRPVPCTTASSTPAPAAARRRLATNIDFAAWADYLGDPPLATAFLDRLVDGAVILKLTGRSYRAHRARPAAETGKTDPA